MIIYFSICAFHVDDPRINFGVSTRSTCPPLPVGDDGPPLPAWKALKTKDETSFVVEIGQSGGKRGYTGITGEFQNNKLKDTGHY